MHFLVQKSYEFIKIILPENTGTKTSTEQAMTFDEQAH